MRRIIAILGFGLSLWGSAATAKTQCSCPTVGAVGEGNSSCSVAEYNKRCTVDFNQFGEAAERRALAALTKTNPPDKFKPVITPGGPCADVGQAMLGLGAKEPERVAATAVLYMTVPVTAQRDGRPLHDYSEQDLSDLVAFASANQQLFADVFGRKGPAADPKPESWNNKIRYVYTGGCMEVLLPGGLNVMLKMSWSGAAEKSRCGK